MYRRHSLFSARFLSCLLAVPLVLAVSSVGAVSINWIAGDGDWFDPDNWDPAQVPTGFGGGSAGDDALINNGGTANADSTTAPPGSAAATRTLGLGASSAPGSVSGSLHSNGVEVTAVFGLDAGVAGGDAANAEGQLTIQGADLDLAGTGLDVGVVASANGAANAEGEVRVTDGGVTAAFGNIGVAQSDFSDGIPGPATMAEGSVVVDGNVIGGFSIGSNVGGSAGTTAVGGLTVTDGDLDPRGRRTVVGQALLGDGSAAGAVVLDSGSFSLADSLNGGSFPPDIVIGIARGGTASGEMLVAGMDMAGNALGDLSVGLAGRVGTLGEASGGGMANGRLVSGGGDVEVLGSVVVGEVLANNGGSATGFADFGPGASVRHTGSGGVFTVGQAVDQGLVENIGQGTAVGEASAHGLEGFDLYSIGVSRGTVQNADREATGVLSLGPGGIQGNADGDSLLYVGASLGSPNNSQLVGTGGTANGSVIVSGGDIVGMRRVAVGVSESTFNAGGHGSGAGELQLHDGSISTGSLAIGNAVFNQVSITAPDTVANGVGVFAMRNGTLTIEDGVTGSPGLFRIGTVFNSGSSAGIEDRPVFAQGDATLTDVAVVGGNLSVATAFAGFAEGDSDAVGRLEVLRGGLDIASLGVGQAIGGTNVSADGRVSLTDTRLVTEAAVTVGAGSDAFGELMALNTDIEIGTDLNVARIRNLIAPDPPLLGRVQIQGGTLNVGGNAAVGSQFTGGRGELLLEGVADATVGGFLRVGASSNLGSLFGIGLLALQDSGLDVGNGAIFDSGEVQLVDSRLSVTGDLEMSRLTSFDAEATAAASLHLRRSLVEVTGAFTSGEGDLLEIAIDGAVRGSEYGALDVGSARLGGDLQVDFAGFTGVDMAYVFDLIVADAVGAVTGDFTGLSVLGLSPLYAVSTGLEQGDFGAGLVDVYRLRIEQVVSSPSALALMLLSLAWFPAAQWRNRHVSLRE